MSFTAPKFTNAGRQLQTRVIAGDTLTFTAIKLGDGTMTTEPIAALTDLIHGIITLPVHEVRRNADYADVTGVFQNAGLSSGFYWREIGIFAADPDYPNDRSHDILYCYQNAAELAEYIPSASSAVIEKIIRVACVVGDAENITVGLASQAYAKAEDLQALEEQYSKDVERINDALDAVDPTKITTKATPSDGDGVMIADSADGGKAKRLLWSSVKAALGKLFVPLARKINGKALSADVTLTGDDIAMGADDAESLRAAMAKRAVGSAVLSDNADLDTVTVSGMYRLAAMELPWQTFSQMLVVHGGADTISQVIFAFSGGGVYVRNGNPTQVGGPGVWSNWKQLAVCAAPEVHDLPLNIAGSDNSSHYTIDQFGRVFVQIRSNLNTQWSGQKIIGTMPEGFRPKYYDAVVPLLIQNDPISFQIGQIFIQPGGNIYVHGSFTSAEYIFAQLTYPASV